MRITTWNVNGIRAVLGKGFKEWVLSAAPDVLCLQEIKATEDKLTDEQKDFPGYQIIWNPAQRPGYSGVATFTCRMPQETSLGIGVERFDVEGRSICTRFEDVYLFNIYFPNGQRGQERLGYKLDFYQRVLELCDDLHQAGKSVILTGDFNTAHMPIDLRNPKENVNTSGFMPEERAWVDKYLQHGLVDIYRRLYPDRVQYTWWTYRLNARQRNIGWRIDYFLVSESLAARVSDVIIHEGVTGSDHCPVTLIVD